MSEAEIRWPLAPELRGHVEQLATLIRQFGAARFTGAPIVAANEHDFPDRWEPTLTGVQRLMHRLLWHAHWEPQVEVRDARVPEPPTTKMLHATEIELASTTNGVITLDVAKIGNDDVGGLLSHRVGHAFLELAPGDPFRSTSDGITDAQASVAAVFLGLGVLVANSSMYRRYASKMSGNYVTEEQYVATAGGLSIGEATCLLAIQDIVRDDATTAFESLHKPQREWIERWRAVLDDHEDELRVLLGLDDAPAIALSRRDVPRPVTSAHAERELQKFNAGRTTFRVKERPVWPSLVGFSVGMFGFLAPYGIYVGPALALGLAGVGRRMSAVHYLCTDSECRRLMRTLVDECPGCGGSIAETLKHADERLDALERIEEARREERA